MERGDEALAEIRRALELDPLSVIINQDVGEILYWLRRYDEAIEQERRALELDPNSARPRSIIIWSYIHKGMFQEAITELQNQAGANNRDPNTLITVAALYLKMGRRDETQRILNEARRRGARINEANFWSLEHEHVSAISWQGDREAIYRWLASEYEHRGGGLPHVRVDPRFDWLRSDPRFQDYLRRIVPRQ
jgi:adenylate cyclase